MDTSSWRTRVLLEPRGFIKVLEFVLAIVAFATTGGYSGTGSATIKCGTDSTIRAFSFPVSYPFNLESADIVVPTCNANGSGFGPDTTINMMGDFSPTSQWFMFVGVMAFLITLASIVFYVCFESSYRQQNERMVTIGDLGITVLWTFLWLTAAASWAWGVGQVKTYAGATELLNYGSLGTNCTTDGVVCNYQTSPDWSPLNASIAFAFLSFFVWAGNVWFVYKETPYHDDQQNLTPNEGVPPQQVPENQP